MGAASLYIKLSSLCTLLLLLLCRDQQVALYIWMALFFGTHLFQCAPPHNITAMFAIFLMVASWLKTTTKHYRFFWNHIFNRYHFLLSIAASCTLEETEKLLDSCQKLLDDNKYPFEMMPFMYVILKYTRVDIKTAEAWVKEGIKELAFVTLCRPSETSSSWTINLEQVTYSLPMTGVGRFLCAFHVISMKLRSVT